MLMRAYLALFAFVFFFHSFKRETFRYISIAVWSVSVLSLTLLFIYYYYSFLTFLIHPSMIHPFIHSFIHNNNKYNIVRSTTMTMMMMIILIMIINVLFYISFQISCTNRATRRKRNIPIIVRVSDVNDNAPVFQNTPYETSVPEVKFTTPSM